MTRKFPGDPEGVTVIGRGRQPIGEFSSLDDVRAIRRFIVQPVLPEPSLLGIGTKTAALLWQHFVSVEAMKKASLEDLQALPNIGKQKARQLQEALKGIERRG